MEFNKLYLMQKDLDVTIINQHHVSYESTINERIMAFLVELGEFANETRCFKYWSNKPSSAKEICLEEYIDGLHFILSIGIALNCDYKYEYLENKKDYNKTEQFIKVYKLASELKESLDINKYYEVMQEFLNLGVLFDFSYQDLVDAYLKKNEINYQRQENNY